MESHYLLKQSSGWVGIKDDQKLREIRRQRKNKFKAVSKSFGHASNFSIVEYCKAHTPKNDLIYSYFAFLTLLTIIVTFSLDKAIYHENTILINFLQFTSLFISTLFICRNLLLSSEAKEKYLGVIWYISIFISLAFISSFLVLISKFFQISLTIFIINLAMIGMLLNWQTTLIMIITGASLAFYGYKSYIGTSVTAELYDFKLKIFIRGISHKWLFTGFY